MLCLVVAVIINYKLQPTKFAKTNNNSAASLLCGRGCKFLGNSIFHVESGKTAGKSSPHLIFIVGEVLCDGKQHL
jgi:hypothetical protein